MKAKPKPEVKSYELSCSYDEHPPLWSATYAHEFAAFENFFKFKDSGMAYSNATVRLTTPEGNTYTRVFYTDGTKVTRV
jgi:hypothetical protein